MEPVFKDMNGKIIKVGDTVRDWCTGDILRPGSPVLIESEEQLFEMWNLSWSMLEIIDP